MGTILIDGIKSHLRLRNMDKCSAFIPRKAFFGSFPTQEDVEVLEQLGVRWFIDLTMKGEVTAYTTKYEYLSYPIQDHSVPKNTRTFAQLVLKLCSLIKSSKEGEQFYIHCRGGHGRSGVLVACILCHLYKISTDEALSLTNSYHSERKVMRDKWRKIGSPQTYTQKRYVKEFFRTIYFHQPYFHGATVGFSAFSIHSVEMIGLGCFPTAESAYQAHRDPTNELYVARQRSTYCPKESKKLGRECKTRSDWDSVRESVMLSVTEKKFEQHAELKEKLMDTGLKSLVERTDDEYWGDGLDGCGRNTMGKILMKIRHRMLLEKNYE